MSSRRAVVCLAVLLAVPAASLAAEDRPELGEEISVTATRAPRRTRDVPQAISVVGKDVIDDKVVFNVKDVVQGTPGVLIDTKNGGYDARLIIRGAGLKAAYGVREIMLLRDGVPLTDPDSFSRLDWVDTQDIERIEISKGPGNLFSPGTAGGAVQIISKSVFDASSDVAQLGGGYGALDAHLRKSTDLAGNALALTGSYRRQDNPWRTRNEFESLQLSLKHGVKVAESATLESEAAFTLSDLQLPGAMNADQFAQFKRTGEQTDSADVWKHSGRSSRILSFTSKLEQPLGAFTARPRVYYNQWTHVHPVTGAINVTEDWNRTLGADLEAQHQHDLWAARGTLVAGVTAKGQWCDDSRKYQYRDVTSAGGVPTGRITSTLSDARGDLMEVQSQRFLLGGVFLQETVQAGRVTLDVGGRFDHSWMRTRSDERIAYDWGTGKYVREATPVVTTTRKQFDLPAPKAGVSVRLTDAVSLFASAARGAQIPSESEVLSNPGLTPSRSTAYEVGVKTRAAWLTVDASAYWNPVVDEIVSVITTQGTQYQNAGETRKLGAEASASVRMPAGFEVGASYAYSDFTYVRFQENVTVRANPGGTPPRYETRSADRSGNRLPYVPVHQYGGFVAWRHPVGLRLRVATNTWGRYWIDNANTERYRGYALLTSVGAGWKRGRHEALVDVSNLLDDRYAAQVTKDASGTRVSYSAGMPRTFIASYRFQL
jgi:iron complex outermembrane receptor protein